MDLGPASTKMLKTLQAAPIVHFLSSEGPNLMYLFFANIRYLQFTASKHNQHDENVLATDIVNVCQR